MHLKSGSCAAWSVFCFSESTATVVKVTFGKFCFSSSAIFCIAGQREFISAGLEPGRIAILADWESKSE